MYAKTLYKPERPIGINKIIRSFTKAKVPHFFVYAKDKEKEKVEPANKSIVNSLVSIIPNKMLKFKAKNLGRFDYRKLYSNYNFTYGKDSQEIIDKYIELDRSKFMMSNDDEILKSEHELYMYTKIRNEILEVNDDIDYVVNVLVKYLYETKPTSKKLTLWSSFGDVIVNNLNNSIEEKVGSDVVLCERCGDRVDNTNKKVMFCKICAKDINREKSLQRYHQNKVKNTLICK